MKIKICVLRYLKLIRYIIVPINRKSIFVCAHNYFKSNIII
nr:MAG TPA: hypothetical protein [Caudoviricetes sp.]